MAVTRPGFLAWMGKLSSAMLLAGWALTRFLAPSPPRALRNSMPGPNIVSILQSVLLNEVPTSEASLVPSLPWWAVS